MPQKTGEKLKLLPGFDQVLEKTLRPRVTLLKK